MFKSFFFIWTVSTVFGASAFANTVSLKTTSPVNNQQITNGCMQVVSSATSSDPTKKITGWYVYEDGVAKYNTGATPSINTQICYPAISLGTHTITVRAWSSTGTYGTTTVANTNISDSLVITPTLTEPMTPVTGATFNNGLIRIAARATSANQVARWNVNVDGVSLMTLGATNEITGYIPIASGPHQVALQVFDTLGHMVQNVAQDVTVSKLAPIVSTFPNPPANALVTYDVNKQGVVSWENPQTGGVASCPYGVTCPAPTSIPLATQYVKDPVPLSGSDGQAALFELLPGGNPWGNALYGATGIPNNAADGNFVLDFYFLTTSTNIQTIEFDVLQTVNGATYVIGSQCNYKNGTFDLWDAENSTWFSQIPSSENDYLGCNLSANAWHHVRYSLTRQNGTYQYNDFEIDGVNHSLAGTGTYPPLSQGWGDGMHLQVQLDTNYTGQNFSVYVENMNLYRW